MMKYLPFPEFFEKSQCILGEGAVIERLRRNSEFELDPDIVNSAFIYEKDRSAAISGIYRQYLDIGLKYNLPLLLSTPTWRASRGRIAKAGYEKMDVNGDNFRFLDGMRKSFGEYANKVVICGLLSCCGDAYNQAEALTSKDAHEFHSWQANKLAEAGVDFLLAATLPAFSEATGLAKALAATGKPYIMSFLFRPEGTMLDGTPLKDSISIIDTDIRPKPLAYMANCTHASIFKAAMMHDTNSSAVVRKRVAGLLANTAALNPEELDDSEELVEEDPQIFGQSVANLYGELGMKILGGCCGTDDRHIDNLAKRLSSENFEAE
ncbi:MAG: homocysteine S-methyltransferase family protein [Desulfobacterales bacterium]|jgi:homocysteine S-methyltransferase|nr:homocysteine S-methyltransferase family protein [Desulfobacterales bacterium]MDH3880638.1 homocysteine S-methyltransferase family protein [Desulfobacteraceae bacterium]